MLYCSFGRRLRPAIATVGASSNAVWLAQPILTTMSVTGARRCQAEAIHTLELLLPGCLDPPLPFRGTLVSGVSWDPPEGSRTSD